MSWERLHVQVTKPQKAWLERESYTKGESLGEIIRQLIDRAMAAPVPEKK